VKYTQRYVDEFCFRYGNREDPAIFDRFLKQGAGKEVIGSVKIGEGVAA
jgi:hypothetical protein